MDSYGFILTRHVNSVTTNKYWNHSVKLLRSLYPDKQIIIIDDNSDQSFIISDFKYTNVTIIQSEFPGCGELLPYYYYCKANIPFKNAIILHDSVFLHKRINFDKLKDQSVVPLWHFTADAENIENTQKIEAHLKTGLRNINPKNTLLQLPNHKWYGCFGCQSYINRDFLLSLDNKYGITNLVNVIKNRSDRCCLERIMGCIFFTEITTLYKIKSLFGNITNHYNYSKYSFDEYSEQLINNEIPRYIIKVWTGR